VLKFFYRLSLDVILLGLFRKNSSCMATLHCIELSGCDKSCGVYMSRYKIILNTMQCGARGGALG
jgi:hypothetical protein